MSEEQRGLLITFEGPDGAGKTSHIKALYSELRAAGYHVILTREPGGSPVAEKLRAILLNEPVGSRCEVLLFAAARADHLDQVIMPAIRRGDIVLCDRFADSTYAYQGAGRRIHDDVTKMEEFVLRGFEPDYTLFFDVTLEESNRRLSHRAGQGGESSIFDTEKNAFKQRVYDGYKERFYKNPHRMVLIDAMPAMEVVRESVLRWYREILLPQLPAPKA